MKHQRLAVFLLGLLTAAAASAGFEVPDSLDYTPSDDSARAWELTARGFFGYNDNVPIVPESTFFTGKQSDTFAGVSLLGSYRLYQDDAFVLYALGEVSTLLHLGNARGGGGSTDDYDLFVLSPGLRAEVPHQLGGYDATAAFQYTFRHEAGRDVAAIGLSSHSFSLSESVAFNRQTSVTASVAHGIDLYEVSFATPATDDRDANRTNASLGVKHRWDNNRRNVSLVYSFTHHNAEGSNFDYNAHQVTGRFETHLIGGLWGAAELGYGHSNYNGFVSGFIPAPGRREQESVNAALQLIYVIDAQWSIDLSYHHADYTSNQPQFEAQVNRFAVGLNYKF